MVHRQSSIREKSLSSIGFMGHTTWPRHLIPSPLARHGCLWLWYLLNAKNSILSVGTNNRRNMATRTMHLVAPYGRIGKGHIPGSIRPLTSLWAPRLAIESYPMDDLALMLAFLFLGDDNPNKRALDMGRYHHY
jgi:hypothetical protein